jgi:hypothetical protein
MKFIIGLVLALAPLLMANSQQVVTVSGIAVPPHSNAPLFTLYSGSPKGAYTRLAEDLQRVCTNLNIQIQPTDGAVANMKALSDEQVIRTGVRIAFAQQDVVVALSGQGYPAPKVVMPLYNEDVNVLVNVGSHIGSLRDLNGKRVAVGKPGSGNWQTAKTIREELKINWIPVEQSPDESILGLLTGEVDAMILTSGHPIKLFSELSGNMRSLITMLPTTELKSYSTVEKLPANTYLWQPTEVEMKSTRSLLIAASGTTQAEMNEVLMCVSSNKEVLKKLGHPAWNQVTFPTTKRSK